MTMAHTAINGNNLYFVTFDPSDGQAGAALGNSPDPRLKLSMDHAFKEPRTGVGFTQSDLVLCSNCHRMIHRS